MLLGVTITCALLTMRGERCVSCWPFSSVMGAATHNVSHPIGGRSADESWPHYTAPGQCSTWGELWQVSENPRASAWVGGGGHLIPYTCNMTLDVGTGIAHSTAHQSSSIPLFGRTPKQTILTSRKMLHSKLGHGKRCKHTSQINQNLTQIH